MQLEKPKARFVTRKEARAEPRTAVLVRFFLEGKQGFGFLDFGLAYYDCWLFDNSRLPLDEMDLFSLI